MLIFKIKIHVILAGCPGWNLPRKFFISSWTYICEIDYQGQFYYNTNNNSTSMAEGVKAKK